MANTGMAEISWRSEQAEHKLLAWAFAISLALHLAVYGSYEAGRRFGWWSNLHLPAWMHSAKMLAELVKKKEAAKPEPQPQPEVALVFVDVNPAQSTPEPPKESKYYSDKNSQAANPEPAPQVDTPTPKIDGKQTEMIKTEDIQRSKTFPLQPALPAKPAEQAQEEQKPKPAEPPTDLDRIKPEEAKSKAPGDLAMAKPQQITPKEPGEAPRERPRTIREALARMPNNQLAGQKMKQDGGVRRRGLTSTLDVSATAFGAYDAAIIAAVQNQWYQLLDDRNYAGERTGRVTVKFHLNADGSVSEMSFLENTVDLALGLLCQSAIKTPAPYAPWPLDMRHKIGSDYREVTFTFFYN
jgi:outer membrane biosynthesis protein TonB